MYCLPAINDNCEQTSTTTTGDDEVDSFELQNGLLSNIAAAAAATVNGDLLLCNGIEAQQQQHTSTATTTTTSDVLNALQHVALSNANNLCACTPVLDSPVACIALNGNCKLAVAKSNGYVEVCYLVISICCYIYVFHLF